MTTNTKQKFFVVNKLDHKLSLKGGYLIVPGFGYAPLNVGDETEASVVYAVGRKWAEVTDKEPATQAAVKEIEITVDSPYEGMTEAELLASKAPAAAPVVPVEPVVEVSTEATTRAKAAKKAAE